MTNETRTIGEQTFEHYLISQGLNDFVFEKDYEGKNRRPDYSVCIRDREYLFEVKDFVLRRLEQWPNFCSINDIRDRIEDGRKKFKEYKDWPCCLVFFDSVFANSFHESFLEDAERIYSVMYGAYEVYDDDEKEANKPDSLKYRLDGKGKMIRPGWAGIQNTTISALITLRHVRVGKRRFDNYIYHLRRGEEAKAETLLKQINMYEKHLGVIVYENVFARIDFPRDIFCGEYDERYTLDNGLKRVFAGSGVLACEELEKVRHQST